MITLIRAENEPSLGVARKLGMVLQGPVPFRGYEHLLFALRRPEASEARVR